MELSQAHTIIYNHLLELHRQDPEFRFLLMPKVVNPWYGGSTPFVDNENIIVSFWAKTLNNYFSFYSPIGISINPTHSKANIHVIVRKDDNADKIKYFETLAEKFQFKIIYQTGFFLVWGKEFLLQNHDYNKFIDDFIKEEKPNIDIYLKNNNSFDSSIAAISESSFEENIALNEGFPKLYLDSKTKRERVCILKYLKVENYQGIKSLTINNLPNDAHWIFLTGENGYGKTSVLRAIAKGLLGDEELVNQINEKTKISSCTITFDGRLCPQIVEKGNRIFYERDFYTVCYGVARFNITNGSTDSIENNSYTLFKNDGNLLDIEKLFDTADESTFEKITNIFKKIIPNLENISKKETNGFFEIRYHEKNDEGDIFEPVRLNDLAAGYRGIIIMIGDMIRRFNRVGKSFEDTEGIVIIDEFDAHLHPKYQYELPKLLSTVFPKVQFIVSTHSPIPLLGVEPKTAVVLKVNRTKEAGITVERLDEDIDIDRLSANALLTSDIFGFKTIFARGATPDTIESFDDYKDIKEMNELEKRLELKQGFKDLNIKIG